jgi:hypothetical protein
MAIRFLATNLWDATTTTVTSSTAVTGFPASNTQTRLFLEHWRTSVLTDGWIKCNLGTDTVIRAVAIRYSNLRVGDTLNIQAQTAANGDDWDGTPALTIDVSITITAAMVSKGLIVYNWETPPTACQWWRVLMTAAAHPDTYIRIGRIYLGTFVEPARDYDKDWEIKNVTPSSTLISQTKQKYVNKLPQFKSIKISFPSMSAADATKMEALRDGLGSDTAFFVELSPAADLTGKSFYVSCASDWTIRHIYGAQLYSMELEMEEES